MESRRTACVETVDGHLGGRHSIDSDCFELTGSFYFDIPIDYVHSQQLASFVKTYKPKAFFISNQLTDSNFSMVTDRLVPQGNYIWRIYSITRKVSSSECLNFLRSRRSLFVGAQGLSYLWQRAGQKLPLNRWIIALDEREALFKDACGNICVPALLRDSVDKLEYEFGSLKCDWDNSHCLLAVYIV